MKCHSLAKSNVNVSVINCDSNGGSFWWGCFLLIFVGWIFCFQIADLLLLSVAAPMELVHYFTRQFDNEGSACKVAEYSRVLSAVASILNLLAVTVERYYS